MREKRLDKSAGGTSKIITPLAPHQKVVSNFLRSNDISILIGQAGTGKDFVQLHRAVDGLLKKEFEKIVITKPAVEVGKSIGFLPGPQPLDSKVLTPNGWATIENIEVEDSVIGKDGKAYKVTNKSSVNKEPVYLVKTTDGREMECSTLHLMHTLDANDKKHRLDKKKYKKDYSGSVKTLKEIISTLYTKNGRPNHYINYCSPIEFESVEKFIHPYLLGAILGDGFISDSVGVSNTDEELITKCKNICKDMGLIMNGGANDSITYYISSSKENNKPAKEVIITNISTKDERRYKTIGEALKYEEIKRGTLNSRCKSESIVGELQYSFGEKEGVYTNPIKEELRKLGLDGKGAKEKFIPDKYIYCSSIEERVELLRGLMDTDGTCDKRAAAYTTISKQLAEGVVELIRSLGGRATIYKRNRVGRRSHVTKTGHEVISRHPSYEVVVNLDFNPFYISRKAKNYNPAYRHLIGIKSVEIVREDYVQCIKTSAPDGLYITNNYIVTHNSTDEKLFPYERSFFENLEKLVGKQTATSIKSKISFEHVGFIRGNTFPEHSAVIISELQNFTLHELITYVTRLPESSKLFMNGDPDQIDIKGSGIFDFLKIMEGLEGVGVMELDPEVHQMRRKLIVDIMRRYKNFKDDKTKVRSNKEH